LSKIVHNFCIGKSITQIKAILLIFQKMTRVNNRQRGEILPNLVTLVTARERERERERVLAGSYHAEAVFGVISPIHLSGFPKKTRLSRFLLHTLLAFALLCSHRERALESKTEDWRQICKQHLYLRKKGAIVFYICQQKSEFTFACSKKKKYLLKKSLSASKKNFASAAAPAVLTRRD
jgi:hypothetical protein